jgi:hypothetical protein
LIQTSTGNPGVSQSVAFLVVPYEDGDSKVPLSPRRSIISARRNPVISRRVSRRKARQFRRRSEPLAAVMVLLDGAYSSCVTVQCALKEQNVELDGDFAVCLRLNVSGPISRAADALRALPASPSRSTEEPEGERS